MGSYLLLKFIHILSSTLLFGTGIGTAFYMLQAYRTESVETIYHVNKNVVLADFIFTTPAVIIQPFSGYLMMLQMGYPFSVGWIAWSLVLYILVGICWLPVVWLQIKMRDLALESWQNKQALSRQYHRYFKAWFLLGWPAFLAVIFIFYFMIAKPF